MNGTPPDADAVLALVDEITRADPRLTPLQASLIGAARLGIAEDSRSVSRIFDIPHALVLRALNELAAMGGMITIVRRDPRTLRTYFRTFSANE